MPDNQPITIYQDLTELQPFQPPKDLEAPTERREYDCVFMQPGRVLQADGAESTWLIPAEVIATHATKFSGLSVYVDHPSQFGLWSGRQAPQVKNLAGVTFDAYWDENKKALIGGIRLYDEEPGSPGAFVGALLDQILEDQRHGRPVPPIGLSATFYQRAHLDEETGLTVTDEIRHAISVDFVWSAGARGYVRAALAALELEPAIVSTGAAAPKAERSPAMPEETTIAPAVAAAPQEPISREQNREPLDQAALYARIEQLEARLAAIAEQDTVQDMGHAPRAPATFGIATGLDQVTQALDAMMLGVRPPNGIRPLTGIRELYHLLSGDYEMTGVFNEDRVYLANVTSSTMAALVANAMNKVVINEFQAYPHWWAPAVTITDFASLQDARWITLGGVGELPTVAEGAAYTELTWDDNTETASFVKKGGYLGITIEAIDKDDTRRLRAAPNALAQAAWLTLGKSISDIFTYNSGVGHTLADTLALFHATHGNLGSTALSLTSWRATRLLMMKYTEINSGERLGALTAPRLLWVPLDLEDTAITILASANEPGTADNDINPDAVGNERETRLANARARVIACPLWTDTNDWCAQADPRLYPGIGLGFRYGRTPEIYSVADPRAGLMFSNDVMPIKVRFLYATGAIDYRAFYKHNV